MKILLIKDHVYSRMKMNNLQFYNFPRITVAYFTSFVCIEVLVEQVICLKRLTTSTLGSSEPLNLSRLLGVSSPSQHRESTYSLIKIRFKGVVY